MTDKVTTVDESGAVLETTSTSTAVAEFDPISAGLAQLKVDIAGTTYDIATTKGLDTARRLRALCVKLRTSAGEVYDTLNRPMLDKQTLIRKLKNQFITGVEELEEPIDAAIKAQEKIKEQERQARVAAEEVRVKALRDKIAVIASLPVKAVLRDAKGISALMDALLAVDINEVSFAEFASEAAELKTLVHKQLAEIFVVTMDREAETERVRLATLELEYERAKMAKEAAEREAAAALQRQADEQAARLAREQAELQARAARQKEDDERAERQRQADAYHAAAALVLKNQQDAFEAERQIAKQQLAERDATAAAERKALQAQIAALAPKPVVVEPVLEVIPKPVLAAALEQHMANVIALVDDPCADRPIHVVTQPTERPCDALIAATLADAFDANINDVIEWLREFNSDAVYAELEQEEFAS